MEEVEWPCESGGSADVVGGVRGSGGGVAGGVVEGVGRGRGERKVRNAEWRVWGE